MTKEEIQKNGEHWYEKYKEVKHELEQERKLNAEIKARFVKCNTCTDEMKDKCLMFSENLCEGERCEELVDLMALVSKNDLQKENEQLKQQVEKMKCCGNCKHYQFQNDAGYYTCTKDGKRNGKNYRSCEFNLEKWEGR